jgi:aspartate aminotransferase-like enzyme
MMDSGMINLSTGPVQITPEVKKALGASPIAHRTKEFSALYRETSDLLKHEYNVRHCYFLTGSGTLANEAMLHQLKQKGKGLILSNGEFGERLIDQANRISLDLIFHKITWGEIFDITLIRQLIIENGINWIAFTHCETSTGVVNDLNQLLTIAQQHHCECYVDCMSTIGTQPLDLSGVTMATASSGKGLASIPGLALIFSNIDLLPSPGIPSYLDLGQYFVKSGVPFTLSSNLIAAINVSIKQKLSAYQYNLISRYRPVVADILHQAGLAPFSQGNSFVFTMTPQENYESLLTQFSESGLVVSFESEYLRKRKWIQLALFNFYSEDELKEVVKRLQRIIQNTKVKSQKQLTHF